MIRQSAFVALLFMVGACASTAPEAPATDATANSEADEKSGPLIEASAEAMAATDPNEIICRKEKTTGSRFTTRVCRTRAEIEARKAKDQESMNQMRTGASGGDCALNRNC